MYNLSQYISEIWESESEFEQGWEMPEAREKTSL